jgi:hypothetical protein
MPWIIQATPRSQRSIHHFSTGSFKQQKPAVVGSRSAYHSVCAVVRWNVRRIIWATEPIVINATAEMMPSNTEVSRVDMRHAACANAVDVVSAETSDATNTQASHVAPVKAADTGTDVTAAKAAKAAAVSSATTTTAAPGLRARGKKAAGKHCACQNHHCSSCHDILH